MDINPQDNPDIICDANELEMQVSPNYQDYLLAECLTFDPNGKDGVVPARLLQQANKVLKMGGILIIKTASFENLEDTTIPNRSKFAELMVKHGFETVIELGEYNYFGEYVKEYSEQRVIFYCKKVANGFDEDRVNAIKKEMPRYDSNTGKPLIT